MKVKIQTFPMNRRTSIENTSLTEVITIYEKLKKPRDHDHSGADVFRSTTHFGVDIDESDFAESSPLEPFNPKSTQALLGSPKILDFNKYKGLQSLKYHYFSPTTGLVQAHTFEELKFVGVPEKLDPKMEVMNYVKLLKSKQYWFNIMDPSEKDLALLSSAFSVHDLTLRDIREGHTEEKLEVYKHYMFISLRLLTENVDTCRRSLHHDHNNKDNNSKASLDKDNSSVASFKASSSSDDKEDVDFNILLFSDFIITIHDKHWGSIKDVLGFLNLLCTYGNSPLTPDWVLFSIFIELAQDAKYSVSAIEPKILNIKIAGAGSEGDFYEGKEPSKVLRMNFQYEFEIYKISRFTKPKMNILKLLRHKGNKRLGGTVVKLLSNICTEFEDLLEELGHFSHILERSLNTFLAMASVQQSLEANDMGKFMKCISEVALIFLPVQAIGGFLGMNVMVPYQEEKSTVPFWCIVAMSLGIAALLYILRHYFSNFCFFCKRKKLQIFQRS
jgi:Mg2+ and Co2+ transporter CorA